MAALLDECSTVSVSELKGNIPASGVITLSGREGDTRVALEATRLTFGQRWWFLCPLCDRRSGKLYVPPGSKKLACRICHKIRYESQDPHVCRLWREIKTNTGVTRREFVQRVREIANTVPEWNALCERAREVLEKSKKNEPQTALPDVKVRLFSLSGQYQWVVDECPWCHGQHVHVAGSIAANNPRALLGPRVPPCLSIKAFGYVLVEDRNTDSAGGVASVLRGQKYREETGNEKTTTNDA